MESDGVFFEINGGRLSISISGNTQIALDVDPVIEGTPFPITDWTQSGDAYSADVGNGTRVFLGLREGYFAYWHETDIPEIRSLVYFSNITFDGNHWRAYNADAYDRNLEKAVDLCIPIASAYDDIHHPDGSDGHGLTDPGDNPPIFMWNMPSQSFSLETENGWFGLTMPGPWPTGITRLSMEREVLSMSFDVVRPACVEGKCPVVYFIGPDNDPYHVLDAERRISEQLGLTRSKPAEHPAFWSAPGFKAFLEQHRIAKERENNDDKDSSRRHDATCETMESWIHQVRADLDLGEMYAIVEQGVYNFYGDYRPTDSFGGIEGFRSFVDRMHAENVHLCFYIHPYICNRQVEFYKAHPEAFCKPVNPDHRFEYGLEYNDKEPQYALIDWTHPTGREYILDQVKMLISDEDGCLNCDWLRSNHWRSPDAREYEFHDPDWGIGDLMSMKVERMIYEKVKSIKPHACVSKVGFAAPYMQPFADLCILAEDWNGWTSSWYTRGRIASRLLTDTLFMTDPYFLTVSKSYEYYMGMAAWNVMEDPIVRHAIHPYTYYRELSDKDLKRRRSGVEVQRIAPINITDEIQVEPRDGDKVDMWRKRTHGPLNGWYASLAFGKRCFAAYCETEARVGASQTRMIDLPLPPGADVQAVEMVPHEGAPTPWQAETIDTPDGPGLRLQAADCGFEAKYVRVRYEIGK